MDAVVPSSPLGVFAHHHEPCLDGQAGSKAEGLRYVLNALHSLHSRACPH